MKRKPVSSKVTFTSPSLHIKEKLVPSTLFPSIINKNEYDWLSDEGLDLDIDSTAYAYLDPNRTFSSGIMNLGKSPFLDKSTLEGQMEDPNKCRLNCLTFKSLPWWFVIILKLLIISALLLIPPLVIIYLSSPNHDYYVRNFIPGTHEFWKEKVLPVIIYIEVCFVIWMLGKLFYILLLRYVHYYIMSKPTSYTSNRNPSLWNRIFSSNKFQIFVASSHVIFFTIYTGLILSLFVICFNVPSSQLADGEWLSSSNLIFFGYKTLLILLVGSILYSVKKLFIAKIIGDFYQTAYSERLHDFSFAFQALKRLYEHCTGGDFPDHRQCQADTKVRKIYFERHPDPESEKKYHIQPIQIPNSYSQIHYIIMNPLNNEKFIESRMQAKKFAKMIFEHFYPGDQSMFTSPIPPPPPPHLPLISSTKRTHHRQYSGSIQQTPHNISISNNSLLKREHLDGIFTDADLVKVFRIFDPNNNGSVHPLDMKIALVSLNLEKSRLVKSLRDHGKAVTKLDTISLISSCVLTLVLAPTLLGYPLKGLEAIVAFLLSCKFMFSESLSHLLQSIIFLFVTHPFDVGDRVFINDEVFFVHEMGLFCTSFHRFDSHLIYYPNSILHDLHIINIRRSGNMTEWVDLAIDISTPKEKINALNEMLSTFILSENREFETELDHLNNTQKGNNHLKVDTLTNKETDPNTKLNPKSAKNVIKICGWEIINCNLLRLGIALRHKSNFQDGVMRINRHIKFMSALQGALVELGIKYYPPTRRFDFSY